MKVAKTLTFTAFEGFRFYGTLSLKQYENEQKQRIYVIVEMNIQNGVVTHVFMSESLEKSVRMRDLFVSFFSLLKIIINL